MRTKYKISKLDLFTLHVAGCVRYHHSRLVQHLPSGELVVQPVSNIFTCVVIIERAASKTQGNSLPTFGQVAN